MYRALQVNPGFLVLVQKSVFPQIIVNDEAKIFCNQRYWYSNCLTIRYGRYRLWSRPRFGGGSDSKQASNQLCQFSWIPSWWLSWDQRHWPSEMHWPSSDSRRTQKSRGHSSPVSLRAICSTLRRKAPSRRGTLASSLMLGTVQSPGQERHCPSRTFPASTEQEPFPSFVYRQPCWPSGLPQ